MKKSLSFWIVLLTTLSMLLASCAGVGQTPAADSAQTADGAIKIRIFSPQSPDGDLTTNSFTLEAQEMFNIQFEWETTTMDGNAAKEKRQISLDSGDYPDLYMLIPWVDQFSQTDLLRFRDGWVQATDIYGANGYERRLQEATNLYNGNQPEEVFPHWAIWIDPTKADELAMLRQNITDYVNQNALQFVTGAKDLDSEWDAYVAGLEQLNLAGYLETMQQAYDTSFQQ